MDFIGSIIEAFDVFKNRHCCKSITTNLENNAFKSFTQPKRFVTKRDEKC